MDYKTTLNYDIIRCKLKIIERNAYGYHIGGKTMGIKTSRFEKIMRDAVQAISDLLIENQELLNDKKKAEAEVEKLRNEHLKIQYGGEELTVQEICERLKLAECRAITAEKDKASLLQDKRSTDLYIRDKDSGRIHRVGDECHDGLWVDVDGTVHYFNLQNGDGCSDNSRMDKNAGYEFMPSDFGELMVCLSDC